MKNIIRHIDSNNVINWIANIATIIALILACLKPDNGILQIIAYVTIAVSLLCVIIHIIAKSIRYITREDLIKTTQKLMTNSQGGTVMFGGDLSWTRDYLETIKTLTKNHQMVTVFFPSSTYDAMKNNGSVETFDERVEWLREAGVIVKAYNGRCNLRCTIIGIDDSVTHDNIRVILSKRNKKTTNDPKGKYSFEIIDSAKKQNANLFESIWANYILADTYSTNYKELKGKQTGKN